MGQPCTVQGLGELNACSSMRSQHDLGDAHEEVRLNIYDIGENAQVKTLNRFLQRFGTGVFHCGVEMFGWEWSFSDMGDIPEASTGLFGCRPKFCEDHTYSSSVEMGQTFLRESQVRSLLILLRDEWLNKDYDAIHHNCCHFCEELCVRLGVGNIPLWVRSLAGAGEALENRAGEFVDISCCVAIADNAQQHFCASHGDDGAVKIVEADGELQDIQEGRHLHPREGRGPQDNLQATAEWSQMREHDERQLKPSFISTNSHTM